MNKALNSLKEKSAEELKKELETLKHKLSLTLAKARLHQHKKVDEVGKIRKTIARIMFLLNS
jgi:ribosomal protein L29